MHGYAWIRKFIQLCIMCQMSVKILKWHISLCTTIRVQHTRHKHFDIVFISCRLHSFNLSFILSMIPMKTATIPLKCIFFLCRMRTMDFCWETTNPSRKFWQINCKRWKILTLIHPIRFFLGSLLVLGLFLRLPLTLDQRKLERFIVRSPY